MGLFDKLVSGVVGKMLENVDPATIPGLAVKYLGGTEIGSIGGLLERLQQGGLDREVASWLGAGSNLPVTADQLRAALGDDVLAQVAAATGLSVDKLLALMSAHLPQTIDTMSPNGRIEEPAPQGEGEGGSLAAQAGLDDLDNPRG
jgi:uncharacterized protein YidB (DUF937 family)